MENFKWKLNRWRKEWEIILSFRRKLNGKINTINVSLFEKRNIYKMDKNIRIHLFKLMAFKLYVTPFFGSLFLERSKKLN